MVLVKPKPDGTPLEKDTRHGQEFDMVTEGGTELTVGNKVFVLNGGDGMCFDAMRSHCMRALNGKAVRFLAVII